MNIFNQREPTFNEIREDVKKLKNICMTGVPFANYLSEPPNINDRLWTLEKKLNRLIDHLGLEEHKPSCDVVFRGKEK